jgi:KDO2-lipid IV(A) lauroyltransferase
VRTRRQQPTLSDRIEFGALRAVAWLFARLGVDRASAFSGWCWRRIGPLTRRQRRVDFQLRLIFPDADAARIAAIGREMWTNLGRVFAESLLLDAIAADPDRIDLSGVAEIAAFGAAGQPLAFGVPHMGNWEVAAMSACRTGQTVAGVYKRLSNPLVEHWLFQRRLTYFQAGLIDATDKRTAIAALLRVLKGGSSIAMMVDLYDDGGQRLDFIGHPARCVDFPAMAARMMAMPLFAVRIVRTEGVRFRVEAERIAVPVSGDKAADIAAANAALHGAIARWIAADPGQWFWIHLKWEESRQALRRRPPEPKV